MAKVTGPAFSVEAHGELGGGICFTRCKSGHRVILSPQPGNPNSASQSAHRASFHSAKSAWKSLSLASKAALNAEADLLHMTGYNLYIKRVLLGQQAIGEWHEGSLERQIAQNSDDCEVSLAYGMTWIIDPVYSRVRAGHAGDDFSKDGSGLRWLNITVPLGATILTAHIHFKCGWGCLGDNCLTQFVGDNEDNAANFTTMGDYLNRRGTDCGGPDNSKRTIEEVDWDIIEHWLYNEEYVSPDISPIAQEIMDRPGRVVGDAMVVFWDDHKGRSDFGAMRQAYSHNFSPGWSPKLHMTYRWFG